MIEKTFWFAVLIVVGVAYWHWVASYNAGLDSWEPIVAECSQHGGFMTATGTCVYNQ
jgi:hypothetical protein